MRTRGDEHGGSDGWLTDRCCLTCGFRGRELQGRRGQERGVCPQCRQDLCGRPARSYAEMEGLAPTAEAVMSQPTSPARRRVALLRLAGGLIGAGLSLVRAERSGRRLSARV